MTGGRGPDACIDAVGMESHGTGAAHAYDRVKQSLRLQTDRGDALREAIRACRKGGTLSILGVYGVAPRVSDVQGEAGRMRASGVCALTATDPPASITFRIRPHGRQCQRRPRPNP
jgi:threonine dehydrogenase-like Zn-dependent dehydrogenase